jgi:hypothetical protein
VQQLSLYVMTNERSFPTESSKVAFGISYLAGDASVWAAPLVRKLLGPDKESLSFKEFLESFKGTYFDPHRVAKAENAIRALWQTNSVLEYATKFNQLASMISWEDATLLSHFKGHLKPEITVPLIWDTSTTLDAFIKSAIEVDHLLHLNQDGISLFHNGSNTRDIVVQAGGGGGTPNVTRADDTMDLSTVRFNISRGEYQRRKAGNLCYYCGKPNHSAARCTQARADREKKSAWRSQISEMEIESSSSGSGAVVTGEPKNGPAQE